MRIFFISAIKKLYCYSNYLLTGLFLLLIPAATPAFGDTGKNILKFLPDDWSLSVGINRLINSHTSYEFGFPFPPYYTPLSRLEFPLDSWWASAEIKADYRRFALGFEVSGNLSSAIDRKMCDSDWEDYNRPELKTIYSESNSRFAPSYIIDIYGDMKLSDLMPLPSRFDLRPVIGFRFQHFRIVTYDGVQKELGSEPIPLSGNTIRFIQKYRHYYIGLKGNFNLENIVSSKKLNLVMQLDWAYVQGKNEDLHLLRNNRFTFDITHGQAMHGLVGLKAGPFKNFVMSLEFDHMWVRTEGSHRLFHEIFEIDFTFDYGVKVWSSQTVISLVIEHFF